MSGSSRRKSIGIATLKTLGTQYSSFVGIVDQVVDLHSEFEAELSSVLSLIYKSELPEAEVKVGNDKDDVSLSTEDEQGKNDQAKRGDSPDEDSGSDIEATTPKDIKPWIKKLFKRIAVHCHPDKVLSSNQTSVEKHRRLSSYEQARFALDDGDEPMMISIGLLYNEMPSIGQPEAKKILTAGVRSLENQIQEKQKSLVWAWGMSEEDLTIKSKILVHAAKKLYNKDITEQTALSAIKKYFQIRESKKGRKVGTHPGRRLKDIRKKQNDD